MSDSIAALAAAQREVFRCQRALSRGTPVKFWVKRLEDAAKRYEAAACILRMQLMTLGVRDCTCLGGCRGADGLAPGWLCAKERRFQGAP